MQYIVKTMFGSFFSKTFKKEEEEEVTEFLSGVVTGNYNQMKFTDQNGNIVILSHDVIKNCIIKILKDEKDD